MVFYNYTSAAPAGTSVATVNATGESTDDAVITFATPDGCTSGTSMPAPVDTAEAKDDAAGIHAASQGW